MRIDIANGETVGLAEWIIDDTRVLSVFIIIMMGEGRIRILSSGQNKYYMPMIHSASP